MKQSFKELTPHEVDVIYQLLNATRKLWKPNAAEQRVISRFTRAGLLVSRGRGLPHVSDALFGQFRNRMARLRQNHRALPENDQAVLCAIRAEPEYNFVFGELRTANRLAREGVLRPAAVPGRFLITVTGYAGYRWDPIERHTVH